MIKLKKIVIICTLIICSILPNIKVIASPGEKIILEPTHWKFEDEKLNLIVDEIDVVGDTVKVNIYFLNDTNKIITAINDLNFILYDKNSVKILDGYFKEVKLSDSLEPNEIIKHTLNFKPGTYNLNGINLSNYKISWNAKY